MGLKCYMETPYGYLIPECTQDVQPGDIIDDLYKYIYEKALDCSF